MATTTLVGDLVAGGREIIQLLEQAGVSVDTALWLQDDETGEWRLVIASPYVDRHGARPVYEHLFEILNTMQVPDLRLHDISVRTTGDRLIKDLKRLVGTNERLHEIRLDYVGLGGQLYRTARIYRAVGGSLENGARVRVKANGRLGTVREVFSTPHGKRYLVMYDRRPEDMRPLGSESPPEAGRDFAAEDLEFLYVVHTGG